MLLGWLALAYGVMQLACVVMQLACAVMQLAYAVMQLSGAMQSAEGEVCQEDLLQGSLSQRGESQGVPAVVELSVAIIDDYPAADPRWAESSSLRGTRT